MRDGFNINASGTREWWKNGVLHRDDGPAVEWVDGARCWYKNGERHRDDGPAVEYADGTREWWRYGYLHRDDGPAIEWASGTRDWYKNGIPLSLDRFLATLAPEHVDAVYTYLSRHEDAY